MDSVAVQSPHPPAQRAASSPNEHRRGPRHCWVVLPGLAAMPGVVAGWRRVGAGNAWEGRVAYALGDETGGVVTGWLPASLLRPYETTAAAAVQQAEMENPQA